MTRISVLPRHGPVMFIFLLFNFCIKTLTCHFEYGNGQPLSWMSHDDEANFSMPFISDIVVHFRKSGWCKFDAAYVSCRIHLLLQNMKLDALKNGNTYVFKNCVFVFRWEVFDTRPKSAHSTNFPTRCLATPRGASGTLTPSEMSTTLTGIGTASKPSYTITRAAAGLGGQSTYL